MFLDLLVNSCRVDRAGHVNDAVPAFNLVVRTDCCERHRRGLKMSSEQIGQKYHVEKGAWQRLPSFL